MPVVVLFKSESDGPDKFADLLRESNFDVRSIACLSFQFKNIDLLLKKLNKADDYEGIIFTSPRSVEAVRKATETQSGALDSWKKKSNYSVGDSTSELALSFLHLEPKGKESGNAQRLANLIISDCESKRTILKTLLFPSGNLKLDILENSLRKEAIEVEQLEVYETISHSDLDEKIESLKTERIDFLVFFSPSGVKFALPILKRHEINLRHVKVIAIGPSTKKCLEETELKCFQTCTTPTPESLLEALLKIE